MNGDIRHNGGKIIGSRWKKKLGINGRIYYCSDHSKTVQLLPPPNNWICKHGLPYGWEMAFDADAKPYFINHVEQSTTYEDPRSDMDTGSETSSSEIPTRPRRVVIHRDTELGFGFIAGSEKPVIVRSVTPGGPSDGKLMADDQIVQIDWHHVTNVPREDVIHMIREQETTLTLTVMQPNLSANSSFLKPGKKCIHPSDRPKVRFCDDVNVNNSQERPPPSSPLLVRPGYLRIRLENHQIRSFAFEHDTLAADAIASICSSFGFKDPNLFALVLTPPRSSTEDISSPSSPDHNNRCDVISDSLLIAPWDSLSKVVNNVAVRNHTCRFRMMYMAKDFHTLARNDPEAFKYLYVQSVNDVTDEDVYCDEMTEDEYMKLACIHIQEMFVRSQAWKSEYKFKFGNNPSRINLKQFEREYGLKTFLPASLLHKINQEGRSARKILQQYYKENFGNPNPLLSPSAIVNDDQAMLTVLRQNYLKVVSPQHLFGGRYFEASIESLMDSEMTLLIGHHYGVSEMINKKTKMVSVLASFRNISKLEVKATSMTSTNTSLNIECYDGKSLKFFMSTLAAHNMALMTAGYCRVHGNADMELTLPTPDSMEVPLYFGIHKVIASSWNYPTQALDKSVQREYFFCDFSEPMSSIILAKNMDINENNIVLSTTEDDEAIDEIFYENDATILPDPSTRPDVTPSDSGSDTDLTNLIKVLSTEKLACSADDTTTSGSATPVEQAEVQTTHLKEDGDVITTTNEGQLYENLKPHDSYLVTHSEEDASSVSSANNTSPSPVKPNGVRDRTYRLSTFKPNEDADLKVFSQTNVDVLDTSTNSTNETSLICSSTSVHKTQSKVNGKTSAEETEELIKYFKEKAQESRNASISSLDAISDGYEIPVIDLAINAKKNKHKTLKERMSWGDRQHTLPMTSPLRNNKYSISNPDISSNQRKRKTMGIFKIFKGKKKFDRLKAASLSNLPNSSNADSLRNFDLAEGANFQHQKKRGFFYQLRHLFGSKGKKNGFKTSKNQKHFSVLKKQTQTGSLDITALPSGEKSIDEVPREKYIVRKSVSVDELSGENENSETVNVKLRSPTQGSNGTSSRQTSFSTFHTNQSEAPTSEVEENTQEISETAGDKKVENDDEIIKSISIKRKPCNRPPNKPQRMSKVLKPTSSPTVPEKPVVCDTENGVEEVKEAVEVTEAQRSGVRENHLQVPVVEYENIVKKGEGEDEPLVNVEKSVSEIERPVKKVEAIIVEEPIPAIHRKSTKRRAPSPPKHTAPFRPVTEDTKVISKNVEVDKNSETSVNAKSATERPVSIMSISSNNAPVSLFDGKNDSLLSEIYVMLGKNEESENLNKDSEAEKEEDYTESGEEEVSPLPYDEDYQLPGVKSEDTNEPIEQMYENENVKQGNLLNEILMEDFMEDMCKLTFSEQENYYLTPQNGSNGSASNTESEVSYEEEQHEYFEVNDVDRGEDCKNINTTISLDDDSLHGSHVHSPIKQFCPPSKSYVTYHNLITPLRFTGKASLKPASIIQAPTVQKKPPVPPKPKLHN